MSPRTAPSVSGGTRPADLDRGLLAPGPAGVRGDTGGRTQGNGKIGPVSGLRSVTPLGGRGDRWIWKVGELRGKLQSDRRAAPGLTPCPEARHAETRKNGAWYRERSHLCQRLGQKADGNIQLSVGAEFPNCEEWRVCWLRRVGAPPTAVGVAEGSAPLGPAPRGAGSKCGLLGQRRGRV